MTAAVAATGRRRPPWVVAGAAALLAVVVVVGGLFLLGGDERDPVVHRFVIPAGTRARLDAGQEVEIVPPRLEVRVGDRLLLRNRDDVQHHMGPLVVDANGLLSMTFSDEGTIKGICTLNDEGESVIVVRS